ncbi:hypothetical protein D3C86_1449740 [compost metagenome]
MLVTIIGGAVTLFFSLFPTFSIVVLFGPRYASASHLLPLMSLLMLLCSYNNLLVCYEIALRRFKAVFFVAASIMLLSASLWIFHDSLAHIILAYLVSNALVLVLLSVYILKRKDHAETTIVSRSA